MSSKIVLLLTLSFFVLTAKGECQYYLSLINKEDISKSHYLKFCEQSTVNLMEVTLTKSQSKMRNISNVVQRDYLIRLEQFFAKQSTFNGLINDCQKSYAVKFYNIKHDLSYYCFDDSVVASSVYRILSELYYKHDLGPKLNMPLNTY